jgi:hypothetical protein
MVFCHDIVEVTRIVVVILKELNYRKKVGRENYF